MLVVSSALRIISLVSPVSRVTYVLLVPRGILMSALTSPVSLVAAFLLVPRGRLMSLDLRREFSAVVLLTAASGWIVSVMPSLGTSDVISLVTQRFHRSIWRQELCCY